MDTQVAESLPDGQTQTADERTEPPESQETDGNERNDEETEQRNEDDDDDGQDLLAMLYGGDDDDIVNHDSDSDQVPDDGDVPNEDVHQNVEPTNSASRISGKRRSEESDNQLNKRIKAEPIDASKEPKEQRLTTTIEAVENDEPPPPDIPKNSYEFMSFLLDLNANNLEGIEADLSRFSMSRNLQHISQMQSFNNFDEFREAFVPYILCNLWLKLKRIYNQKNHNFRDVANAKRFLSILNKFKSQKMRSGLEMKCICIVKQKESPVFRFGQLITIQSAVQARPNSSKHIFTRRKYFGYITSHVIRMTSNDNQSEVNLLRLLNENKKDLIYIEEITFMTKYSDELYKRNDVLLAAEPITCVHNHYLEARVVLKFNEFPLQTQVISPTFSTKPSGLSVVVKERRFDEDQINLMQIALDVVAGQGSPFFAVNGSKESEKTNLLAEIVRQLVVCPHLRHRKVLFCSQDSETLKIVEKYLKTRKIMVHIVGNGYNDSLTEFAIKHAEHRVEKETDDRIKELYEDCLKHFDTGCQLSVESAVLKYSSIADKSRLEAMTCPVIMGRIEDLCNDIVFYRYFTSKQHFNCCVIDDSTLVSEPQFYSLFMFHIDKFIFGGDMSRADTDQSDMFREYGLSRSFFERYYRLHNQNEYQTTVLDV